MYTPAKTQAAEARIAMVVRKHMRREGVAMLQGPLVAHVVGVWPRLVKHKKLQKCSRCRGDGRVLVLQRRHGEEMRSEDCDACDGTGKHSGRLWKESTPDADNLQKLVFDALNGVAYADDARVVRMTGETVFAAVGEAPGVEIRLWQAPEFP
jgi:Holliday junction resolvase RusA-like endonuclease